MLPDGISSVLKTCLTALLLLVVKFKAWFPLFCSFQSPCKKLVTNPIDCSVELIRELTLRQW